MPNCQRCGDFTLLPDLCVDCARPGSGPTVRSDARPDARPAYAGRHLPDRDALTRLAVPPEVVTPPVPRAPYSVPPPAPYPLAYPAPYPVSRPVLTAARSPFAGLGRRVAAYLLDSVVVVVLLVVVTLGIGTVTGADGGAAVLGAVAGWLGVVVLYLYVPEARAGATLGKALLGLRVVRAHDLSTPPGYGYGAVRQLVLLCLGLVPLAALIDLVVAGVDSPERRAIHDRAAGTRVVRADWSPVEGYPVIARQPTSAAAVVAIVLASVAAAAVTAAMLAAVVIPVFLHQRAVGIDVQMRRDADGAAVALMRSHGRIAFPLVVDPGTVGVFGDTSYRPAHGDKVVVTLAADTGAFCVRVENPAALHPVYLDSATGTISATPCDHPGSTTIVKQ